MAGKDSIRSGFPKRRVSAALTGLTITALGVVAEKLFKSVIETAVGVFAGLSVVLMILALFAFFTAWEKREDSHENKIKMINKRIEKMAEDQDLKCTSCSFSHQSLLVGLSANHATDINELEKNYKDYISTVLFTLQVAMARLDRSEGDIMPIVEGLLKNPLYTEEIKKNKELIKWKNFLNSIQ